MEIDSLPIINNETASRFELQVGDEVAWIDYELDGEVIRYTHTEVPPALAGKGIAKKLAYAVMDYAEKHDLEVEAICPVVVKYVKEHPEYHGITKVY